MKTPTLLSLESQVREFALHDEGDVLRRLELAHPDVGTWHPATVLHSVIELCREPLFGFDGTGDVDWQISHTKASHLLNIAFRYDDQIGSFVCERPFTVDQLGVAIQFMKNSTLLDRWSDETTWDERKSSLECLAEDCEEYQRCIQGAERIEASDKWPNLLHEAARAGDLNGVQAALHHSAPDVRDGRDNNALHYAAAGGYEPLIPVLAQAGAGVNAKNMEGNTPLMLAVQNGLPLTCLSLMAVGADPLMEDRQGRDVAALAEIQIAKRGAELDERLARRERERGHVQGR